VASHWAAGFGSSMGPFGGAGPARQIAGPRGPRGPWFPAGNCRSKRGRAGRSFANRGSIFKPRGWPTTDRMPRGGGACPPEGHYGSEHLGRPGSVRFAGASGSVGRSGFLLNEPHVGNRRGRKTYSGAFQQRVLKATELCERLGNASGSGHSASSATCDHHGPRGLYGPPGPGLASTVDSGSGGRGGAGIEGLRGMAQGLRKSPTGPPRNEPLLGNPARRRTP
jgi:hypothetical protein